MCGGTGQVPEAHLHVSDLKSLPSPRLDREAAAQIKSLVRIGRQLMATQLELDPAPGGGRLGFRLARENQELLSGTIPRGDRDVRLAH